MPTTKDTTKSWGPEFEAGQKAMRKAYEAQERLRAAGPDLLVAAKFALSVLRSNGLFELSERLAEEKLAAAIARAEL